MNKELLAQILPIAEKTKEGILKGIEIAQQQMPDLINQVLAWNFIISLLGCLFGLICFILMVWVCKKWLFTTEWLNETNAGSGVAGLFLITISLFIFILNHTWIKILVAPKLFLIEYISNLIK